jgi:hypothetical protein
MGLVLTNLIILSRFTTLNGFKIKPLPYPAKNTKKPIESLKNKRFNS